VFEEMVLREKYGPKRDEVKGEWRKLHNEELCDVDWFTKYYLGYHIRRMRWTGHAACRGQIRDAYRVLVRKPEERDHSEDKGVDGKIILI